MSLNRELRLQMDLSQPETALQQFARTYAATVQQLHQQSQVHLEDLADTFDKFTKNSKMAGEQLNRGFAVKGKPGFTPFESLTKAQANMLTGSQKARAELLRFNQDFLKLSNSGKLTAASLDGFIARARNLASSKLNPKTNSFMDQFQKSLSGFQQHMRASSFATPSFSSAWTQQQNVWKQQVAARNAAFKMAQQAAAGGGSGGMGGSGGGGRGGGGGGGRGGGGMRMGGSAGGRGGFRGAFPQHSADVNQALQQVRSASQGMLLATALANRNVTGLGLGLIFLQSATLPVTAAFAALTLGIIGVGGLASAFTGLTKSSFDAGVQFEKTGQQMANFFRSAQISQDILTQADEIVRRLGGDRNQVIGMLADLQRFNLRSNTYIEAILNASAGGAAGGASPDNIAQRFQQIILADVNQKAGMVRQFAKDFDLPLKHYMTTLDLAAALQKRYAGSADAMSQTTSAAISRITNTWDTFRFEVGKVVKELMGPALQPILAFLNALIRGFDDAFGKSKSSGEFNRNLDNMQYIARRLTPVMASLGYIMGKVIYNAFMIVVRVVKVTYDTLSALWQRIKPVVQTIWTWIAAIKELIDKLISWDNKHGHIIKSLGLLYLAMLAFNTGVGLVSGAVSRLIGLLGGLAKAILSVPSKTFEILMGMTPGDALDRLRNMRSAIDDLHDKQVRITIDGLKDLPPGGLIPGMGGIGGEGGTGGKGGEGGKGGAGGEGGAGATTASDLLGKALANLPQVFAPTLGALLGQTLGLISVPMLAVGAAVLATTILAALVIAFPKQTGQVVGTITSALLDSFVLVGIALVQSQLLIATLLIIDPIKAAILLAIAQVEYIFLPLARAIVGAVGAVVGDVRDIFVGVFTGDFTGALESAWNIVKTLFFTFPVDVSTILIKGFIGIPGLVLGPFWDTFSGLWQSGWDAVSRVQDINLGGIVGAAGEWWDKFKTGFMEKFHLDSWVQTELGNTWKDTSAWFGDWNGNGFLGLFGWGYRTLDMYLHLNPFSHWMDFLNSLWDLAKTVFNGISNLLSGPMSLISAGAGLFGSATGAIASIGNNNQNHTVLKVEQYTGPDGKLHQRTRYADTGWQQDYAFGGIVPGLPGQPILIRAHGGEQFMGAPAFRQGRSSAGAAMGGGDTYNIHVEVSDSVVTNAAAMRDLASSVAGEIMNRVGSGRPITLHRVG